MNKLSSLTDSELLEYHRIYKEGIESSTRTEMLKAHGYDTKFSYHLLRLLDKAQQLLETGEMDIQRAREAMKSIRRGEWKIEDLLKWAQEKEKELDIAFTNCKLPAKADEEALKKLLVSCLETHYGSLSDVFQQPDWATQALRNVDQLMNDIRQKLYS